MFNPATLCVCLPSQDPGSQWLMLFALYHIRLLFIVFNSLSLQCDVARRSPVRERFGPHHMFNPPLLCCACPMLGACKSVVGVFFVYNILVILYCIGHKSIFVC